MSGRRLRRSPGPPEPFLVCITDQPSTANLIRRAWRVTDYFQAECFAVRRRPFEAQSKAEAVKNT